VTFKRWIKEIGGVFVLLVILTEKEPLEAIEAVFLRCAYVLLPLSVVFIKYVPSLGRIMDHTGNPQYVGVADQKNSLGEIVLVSSTIIIWSMIRHYERQQSKTLKEFAWPGLVLLMGLWLLHISDSMTSMLCLAVAALILLSHKLPFLKMRPRFALFFFLGALPLIILLKSVPDISDPLLRMVGRNPTLTNRTEIWQIVKDHPVNPLIGCGYLMYWDLNKSVLLGQYYVTLKTIHNGYLEIYLDGGYLGLAALFFMLICLGIRAARAFLGGSGFGRLLLAFFVVTLFFNLSESIYARRGPLWFSFLLVCIGGSSLFFNRLSESQMDEPQVEPEAVPEAVVQDSIA
jgi:exopolysaccharide production protein ExoQ